MPHTFFMPSELCSSVFATWNPADNDPGQVLSGGNLTATSATASTWKGTRATVSKSAGKWYWEVTVAVGNFHHFVGVCNASALLSNFPAAGANGWSYLTLNGNKYTNSVPLTYGVAAPLGTVIGVAIDMGLSGGSVWWATNGTWHQGGNPATGLTPAYTGIGGGGPIFPSCACYELGNAVTANFGATPFAQTVPAGFNAGIF